MIWIHNISTHQPNSRGLLECNTQQRKVQTYTPLITQHTAMKGKIKPIELQFKQHPKSGEITPF
jgi:hypothetical protein